MRLWRRRRQPNSPVVLPSLDRLAGLIERVVELVDEVGGVSGQASEPAREHDPPVATPAAPASSGGWVAFVSSPRGYTLLDGSGTLPAPGEPFDVDGVAHRVVRHAPSPLPGDERRCAFLEREEPHVADRSFDA